LGRHGLLGADHGEQFSHEPGHYHGGVQPQCRSPECDPHFSLALIKPGKCQEFPNRYLTQEHFRPLEVGGDFIIGNDQILSREYAVDD
jgi:hypothetical protein